MTERQNADGPWPVPDSVVFLDPPRQDLGKPLNHLDAAQRIADVLNEVRAAGFSTSMQDWPECMVTVVPVHAEPTCLRIVHRADGWTVDQ